MSKGMELAGRNAAAERGERPRELLRRLRQGRTLYLMMLPGILWFLLFKYGAMWGVLIAFKDYSPFLGWWESPWVGLKHFQNLFGRPDFYLLLKNTLTLAVLGLVTYLPFTILLALFLNEVRRKVFKKFVQTVVYAPHFVSWVVIAGITILMFSSSQGFFSTLWGQGAGKPFLLLTKPEYFKLTVVLQQIWKEAGWGSVIFLSALSGIDPQLYEAAVVDGASRLRQFWHITLVGIRPTIIVVLMIRLGHFMDVGFEQIFTMLNPLLYQAGDVFDTFAYRKGIQEGLFSYATAVGLFKSLVALALVIGTNWLVKKSGEEGMF